jgi:predicted nucleic-acid-binding protein
MAALDTNVLVRYLVADDARQFAAARRLIRRAVDAGETLFVPVTVVLELEWVLRSRCDFGKKGVIDTFALLLSCDELGFESENALEHALRLFADGAAHFSDCIHVALAAQHGEEPLWTFDKAAARIAGAASATR